MNKTVELRLQVLTRKCDVKYSCTRYHGQMGNGPISGRIALHPARVAIVRGHSLRTFKNYTALIGESPTAGTTILIRNGQKKNRSGG